VSRRRLALPLVACALAGAAALAGSTAGCAQILGFTLDYYQVPDAAQDSSSVVPPADGAVENGDTSPPHEDAVAGDSGDSSDSGQASDADGGTFCQRLKPRPAFCDDFDEDQTGATAFGWDYVHQSKGTLALDTMRPESPPACLMAQTVVVMTSPVTVDTAVYKALTLPPGATTFGGTLDMYMRVDSVDTSGNIAVVAQFGLTDGNGGGKYYLQLVATSGGNQPLALQLNEEFFATNPATGMPTNHDVTAVITPGLWTHVTLSVTVPLAGDAGTAVLGIDNQPMTIPITVEVAQFSAELGLGVLYSDTPSNGWQLAYDNVIFDWSP
jgi:hypothetical protein